MFCRDHADNVQLDGRSATATPVAGPPRNPQDVVASDTLVGAVAVTFTMPESDECAVRRRDDIWPDGHLDGEAVGSALTGAGWRTVTDSTVADGTVYYYAVFCRTGAVWNDVAMVEMNADTGQTGEPPVGPQPDQVAPLPVADVQAIAGDAYVWLGWTFPPDDDLAHCDLRRADGSTPPPSPQSGTLIAGFARPYASTEGEHMDVSVTNGSSYAYAVFCTDLWNNTQSTSSGAAATPARSPMNPGDVAASDGLAGKVTLTFTDSGADACVVRRTQGALPAGHLDGTEIATVPGGTVDVAVDDNNVVAGVDYFYGVFCVVGLAWNDLAIYEANVDAGFAD